MNQIILSTAYLPPVQYFTKFLVGAEIIFDYHETFLKQSYRNRCCILGANGPLDLSIPVIKPNGNKTQTKDITIDYATHWQHTHWRAIKSSYSQSPFFEILANEFEPFYHKKVEFLTDWNEQLLQVVFNALEENISYKHAKHFIAPGNFKYDLRNCISPKPRLQKPDERFSAEPYYQVLGKENDFKANLSIIDLLFNCGPETMMVCKKSVV